MIRFSFLFAIIGLFCISDGNAQVKMSPRGSVSQIIDGTSITVDYARPRLRDRERVFGTNVWWGHIWTPGADDATTIEFDKDIKIKDVPVPAGKYSMWMVHEKGDWEVILDPNWDQFHLPEPPRPDDGYFFWVTPDTTAPVVETLTFDFSRLENFGADLELRWSDRRVVMDIKVTPTVDLKVSQEQAEPYVGTFTTEMMQNAWVPESFTFDMVFAQTDGAMSALIQWEADAKAQPQRMLLKTDQVFYWALFDGDELLGTENIFFEFELDDSGKAESFELRTDRDELWMRGTRK